MKRLVILLLGSMAMSYSAADCQTAAQVYQHLKQQNIAEMDDPTTLAQWTQQADAAVQNCNTHSLLLMRLGDLYKQQKQWDAAGAVYEKALRSQRQLAPQALQLENTILFDLLDVAHVEKNRLEVSHWLNKIRERQRENLPLSDEQTRTLNRVDLALRQNFVEQPLRADELMAQGTKRSFVVEAVELNYRIDFDFNQSQPTVEGRATIQEMAEALTAPNIKHIQVIGHTDAQGDAQYNQRLSLQRAKAVVALLIQQQPSLARKLVASGKGESELLQTDESEETHRLNRRVEFVFK